MNTYTRHSTRLLVAVFVTIVAYGLLPTEYVHAACTNQQTSTASIPTGYGASYNPLTSTREYLVQASCTGTTQATITAGNGNPLTYVYNRGYYYSGTAWTPYTLTCASGALIGGAWCPGRATASIPLPQNPTNVIAYTCQYTNSTWKCGCRDATCSTAYWQLQRVGVTETSTAGLKWYPGHYVNPDSQLLPSKQSGFTSLLTRIANISPNRIRGITVYVPWGVLEPNTKGSYSWDLLDNMITAVAAQGRKVHIGVWWVKFGHRGTTLPSTPQSGEHFLPDYLINERLAYVSIENNLAAKMWDPRATGHYIDLLRAVAERYDNDDRVALISSEEGAFALPLDGSISATAMNSALVIQGKRLADEGKRLFRRTPYSITNNFMGGQTGNSEMTQHMIDIGVGVAVPDTRFGNLQYNYRYVKGERWNGSAWVAGAGPDQTMDALLHAEKQVNRGMDWTPESVYRDTVEEYNPHFLVWQLQTTAYLASHVGDAQYRIPAMDMTNVISWFANWSSDGAKALRTDIPNNVR